MNASGEGADASWQRALERLDLLLERVAPGLDVAALPPPPPPPPWTEILQEHPGWRWLSDTYLLSDAELDVLLIAVAPELDRRYLRWLAVVQDDAASCRPTVDLILRCVAGPSTATVDPGALHPSAPLVRERLLTLLPDPRLIAPTPGTRLVVIDAQIRDVLLRRAGLDDTLAAWCTLDLPEPGAWADLALAADTKRLLWQGVGAAWGRRAHRVYLRGPEGSGRSAVVAAIAGELKAPLLTLDLTSPSADAAGVRTAVREAVLQGAVLHVRDADRIADPQAGRSVGDPVGPGPAEGARPVLRALAGHDGLTVFTGTRPWVPDGSLPGVVEVELPAPDHAVRLRSWQDALLRQGLAAQAERFAPELAARFHLGPGRTADAVATAVAAAGDRTPGREDLFAAARGRGAHRLTGLTRRIRPAYGWADLVLPDEAETQLHDLCRRVTHGPTVWHAWGFERTIAHGRGTTALFAGPSGTGKTMAAEVVAAELGLDLFTVDLSGVVSKYLGETEKNLERVFGAAAEADAVLMFDEADALFGKRSQVNDAHDRYANVETAYLLQRMERYEGVAILATNLRTHLDEAFLRRLQFVVDFPFPDDEHRRRIWEVSLPDDAPREPGLDLAPFARDARLAGGNIRNVVLHAAFLAAADGAPIGAGHLRAAVRHEYRKLGRVLPGALDEPPYPAGAGDEALGGPGAADGRAAG